MKLKDLKTVAQDLNNSLELDPPIDLKLSAKDLKEEIAEASTMLEDGDKVLQITKEVLMDLECDLPAKLKIGKGEKKADSKKGKKEDVKTKKTDKKPGVVATIVELLENGPITKEKAVEKLAKKFPERDPDKMATTFSIQLNRIPKERGVSIEKSEKGYVIK